MAIGTTLFDSSLLPLPGRDSTTPPPVVADRFVVGERLGAGAAGQVYAAVDRATGDELALKWLGRLDPVAQERYRREVTALRAFRVPGVVRILTAGLHFDAAWIAMERVEGAPFPGGRAEWFRLERTAASLLETLARVHALGVLHRDLKPGNVLVQPSGRAVLLDFGLAWGQGVGEDGLAEPAGTPFYMAPEQLAGGVLDVRTDLYAVGAMLFEALTGITPHTERNLVKLYAEKRTGAPRADLIAPDVPRSVADVIDRLLQPNPADRPTSAWEVLRSLSIDVRIPWVGDRNPIEKVVERANEDGDMDLAGGPASGAALVLHLARKQLEDECWETSADLDTPADIVFLDHEGDADRVATERAAGALIFRVVPPGTPGATGLRPASEEALRSLFAGPDRLVPLARKAARALYARTGGMRGAVAEEWAAWLRSGIGHMEDGKLNVQQEDLDRLRGTLRALPEVPIDGHGRSVLDWVVLFDGEATTERLQRALEWRIEDVQHVLEQLARAELVLGHESRWIPLARPSSETEATETGLRRREAHRVAAQLLPVGHPHRLVHQIAAAETPRRIAQGAAETAQLLLKRGELNEVFGTVDLVSAVLAADPLAERQALAAVVEAALVRASTADLDVAQYYLGRSNLSARTRESWSTLIEAARASEQGHGKVALADLDALGPVSPERLELCRQARRVHAARRCGPDEETSVVDALESWADTPQRRGRWLAWKGAIAYRNEDYAQAAEAFREAAALRTGRMGQLAAWLTSALAQLELDPTDPSVRQSAELARDLAVELGAIPTAIQAEWVIRSSEVRGTADVAVDEAILEAARQLRAPGRRGLFLLGEAVAAHRSADSRAPLLATEAAEAFSAASWHGPWLLAAALKQHHRPDPAGQQAVLEACERWPQTSIVAQALALLAPSSEAARSHLTTLLRTWTPAPTRAEVLDGAEINAAASV